MKIEWDVPIRGLVLTAAALLLLKGCGKEEVPLNRPNILLISIDTLRADHLGCYGYERPTSPFLDSLADKKGSVLFERCISQAPNTAPSHMTLFTSLHPVVHGVPNIDPEHGAPGMRFPDATKTLAQMLKEAGYHTAGITDGGYLNPLLGYDKGFDFYFFRYEDISAKVDRTIDWLENKKPGKQSFFLFLHTYEVHDPYLPPAPYRDLFTDDYRGWVWDCCFGSKDPSIEKRLRGFSTIWKRRSELDGEDVEFLKALYDGEIAYTDSELRRLWRYLDEKDHLDNLLVIILSDHGEEFGEHGEFNHKQLFDEVIRVPLILTLPEGLLCTFKPRVRDQVALIDVMPTVLDLLDIAPPAYIQGSSMLPLLKDGSWVDRPAFSTLIGYEAEPYQRSVQHGSWKLLENPRKKRVIMYDLSRDPGETQRAARPPEKKEELSGIMTRWHEANLKLREIFRAEQYPVEVDSELYEELKQLGYVKGRGK